MVEIEHTVAVVELELEVVAGHPPNVRREVCAGARPLERADVAEREAARPIRLALVMIDVTPMADSTTLALRTTRAGVVGGQRLPVLPSAGREPTRHAATLGTRRAGCSPSCSPWRA